MTREKAEGVIRLVWARLILRRVASAEVRRRWSHDRESAGSPTSHQLRTALRLARMIPRLARRLPGEYNCLVQAVALMAMLRRRSIPARIEFGVRQEPESGKLAAHAWVTCSGEVILDSDVGRDYIPFGKA